jgi:hypothetical protein
MILFKTFLLPFLAALTSEGIAKIALSQNAIKGSSSLSDEVEVGVAEGVKAKRSRSFAIRNTEPDIGLQSMWRISSFPAVPDKKARRLVHIA